MFWALVVGQGISGDDVLSLLGAESQKGPPQSTLHGLDPPSTSRELKYSAREEWCVVAQPAIEFLLCSYDSHERDHDMRCGINRNFGFIVAVVPQ